MWHKRRDPNGGFRLHALSLLLERSGPIYDLAHERSRIVSEAYRAAGRPRDINRYPGPDGWRYVHQVKRGPRRWEEELAVLESALDKVTVDCTFG